MIERRLTDVLRKNFQRHHKSVLLLGPRQVGKTTLIDALNPDLKINLAEQKVYLDHFRDPDLIARQVRGLRTRDSERSLISIDEIQRLPSLLNSVQALIDENRTRTFMLTGSSARQLKRKRVNLLPGRLFSYHLYPLTFWEIQNDFDLDRLLALGSLPEVYFHDYGIQLLENYIETYLREEIQIEAVVRNLDSFSRFLDLSAEVSGQIVNYSKLSSESEIPKESLRRYYDILSDTLLVHRIPGYTKVKGSRKSVQKEKIIFFDLGVRNGILNIHRNTFTDTEKGALFEQWLTLQILAWVDYEQKNYKLFFYRDDLKNEVDLIVDTGSRLVAIEVKYSRRLRHDVTKGLRQFSKTAPKPVTSYIVFRGDHAEDWEGIRAIPFQDFLRNIKDWLA